jgi:pimeloyl-[acyl-carrier protein] methyl ester esterase
MDHRPLLIFIHGWGQDGSLWGPMRERLPKMDSVALDLGFFGAPREPALPRGRPLIAVGHSLGMLWLLKTGRLAWDGLVSVSGIARFTRAPDFPCGVPPRTLERMQARFSREPRSTLDDFWRRAGCADLGQSLPLERLDNTRLAEALGWLHEWDARAVLALAKRPVLALASRDDSIVPPALTQAVFGAHPSSHLKWIEQGGHALPWTQPDWCAHAVRDFVAQLAQPSAGRDGATG